MLEVILKLLGLGGETSVANKALGVGNMLALAPVGIWLYRHHEEVLTFHVDVGTLTLVAAGVYVLIELNRRT